MFELGVPYFQPQKGERYFGIEIKMIAKKCQFSLRVKILVVTKKYF